MHSDQAVELETTDAFRSAPRRLCALAVPVAYALGPRGAHRRVVVDIPLEAVMLKISDGTDDFVLLAIPFFVLAGGIMAEAAWRRA